MSKRNHKKRFGAKHNPLGIPSAKEVDREEELNAPAGRTPVIVATTVEKVISTSVLIGPMYLYLSCTLSTCIGEFLVRESCPY